MKTLKDMTIDSPLFKGFKYDGVKGACLKFEKELENLKNQIIESTNYELKDNETIDVLITAIKNKHKKIFGNFEK